MLNFPSPALPFEPIQQKKILFLVYQSGIFAINLTHKYNKPFFCTNEFK